jgi:hypothetical protein
VWHLDHQIIHKDVHSSGRQIEQDCEFLEARGIMDYSMLLGLHFRAPQLYPTPLSSDPSSTPDIIHSNESFIITVDDGSCFFLPDFVFVKHMASFPDLPDSLDRICLDFCQTQMQASQ